LTPWKLAQVCCVVFPQRRGDQSRSVQTSKTSTEFWLTTVRINDLDRYSTSPKVNLESKFPKKKLGDFHELRKIRIICEIVNTL